MIVCLCRGVTDHTIRALIEAGVDTVEDLGRVSGAGTDCGCCRLSLLAMIDETRRHTASAVDEPVVAGSRG